LTGPGRKRRPAFAIMFAAVALLAGCAHVGRLQNVGATIAPVAADRISEARGRREPRAEPLRPLFGDTLIGFLPGTADSSHRFLGRLRHGYTADTLNIMIFGDNRPGFRTSRLQPQFTTIRHMFSLNPLRIARGLVTIPIVLVKGLYPDLALIRDIPAEIRHQPKWGREHQVLEAMIAKIDSLQAHGNTVAAVINTGDLVKDGRYPAHWERFLRITRPLFSRVPYFPIAGNHERTDAVDGMENWRTATGLPIAGDRIYYCFDTADGWVRFIALDTNPIVDPARHWSREVQVKYSDEEFTWLVDRVKEHTGPVIVMMHHPPFSASYHRMEWQNDPVLRERRERMLRTLHTAGISIIQRPRPRLPARPDHVARRGADRDRHGRRGRATAPDPIGRRGSAALRRVQGGGIGDPAPGRLQRRGVSLHAPSALVRRRRALRVRRREGREHQADRPGQGRSQAVRHSEDRPAQGTRASRQGAS